MKYTSITQKDVDERDVSCQLEKRIDMWRCVQDISYFSSQLLGFRPQTFQHLIYKAVQGKHKRIAICCSRQVGKTTSLAVIAIWAAMYNKFPTGRTSNDMNTKIVIISRDDEASKRLMSEIRTMLIAGDARMRMLTGDKIYSYFTSKVSSERKDPDNKRQLTFVPANGSTRGSYIHCFPPTDAITGNPVDLLILDEARFIPDEIYDISIKPTVSTTGGTILMSSTPGGQHGNFFETFDPFDRRDSHEYLRLWFPWTVCELEGQRETVRLESELAEKMGKVKTFQQEYEALFTVDESAFFDLEKVEKAIDSSMVEEYEWHKGPCALGIDYGMTSCNTVITICTKEENGVIRLLYQHEFELNFDDNLLMEENTGEHSIPGLLKRFDVKWIIPDSCASGYRTNKQMTSLGYPIVSNDGSIGGDTGWNFRSDQADRNRGYSSLKSKIHQGLFKMPNIPELTVQMKALQATDNKIYTSIRKPEGGKDDRVDSVMMACIPWTVLDDEGTFETTLVRDRERDKSGWVDRDVFIPANKEEDEELKIWTKF